MLSRSQKLNFFYSCSWKKILVPGEKKPRYLYAHRSGFVNRSLTESAVLVGPFEAKQGYPILSALAHVD